MQESYRIFISHIHEEKELALALQELIHEQLHNNFGGTVQCFLSSDRFQLDAGEDLTVRIKEELSQSDIVLLMLSPQSLERHWVNLEGGAAWMTDRIVIPIHYSGLTVANIPRPYVDFNAIDLETEAYHLLRGIGKRLRPTLTPPPLSDDDPAQKKLQDEIARNSQRLATRTAEAQKKDRSVAPGWQRALRWAPLGLMTIAAVSLALVLFRKPVAESPVLYAQISIPEDLTLHPGDFPVISPDGGHVVLAGSDEEGVRRLWLRSLDRMTFEEMPGTEHAVGPFWSPDSRFVGFFAADSGLKKVSISGGPPLALAAAKHASDLGGSWGSGGAILFAPSYEGPLYRVSSAGGEAVPATVLEPSRLEWAHRNPYFLPDGEHFLYSAWSEASQPSVRLGNLSSGESRLLPNEASSTWYAPPGYSLFNRATTLMAQPFDADKQELTGDPVPIVEGVGRGFATPPYFSASVNGILIYRGDSATSQLTWWDRTGTRLGSPGEPGAYTQIALSPDEKRVAVETRGGGIWLLELSSGVFSRFILHPAGGGDAVWSPDGRDLLFGSGRNGSNDLFRKSLGSSEVELLFDHEGDRWPEDWSPDGRQIIFISSSGAALYALDLDSTDQEPTLLLEPTFDTDEFHFSPDGRWIAWDSLESGRWEIFVATFPEFLQKRQVSLGGGSQPLWRRDGQELFYLKLDGTLMSVEVEIGTEIETGEPADLFQTGIAVNPFANQYGVTTDGQRFLTIEPEENEEIHVIVNWPALLSSTPDAS